MYRFDGSTVLVIKTDVTHTVTHQTTHILPPAGTQNALGERATRSRLRTASRSSDRRARTLDVGERMAHALDGGEAKNTGSGRPLA